MKKTIFIMFLLWSVVCGLWTSSYADIPRLINYQGRLTDKEGKPVADETYSITFRIYNDKDELKWEEKDVMVPVEKGIFSVLLGSKVNLGLPFDELYFLEIKVGDDEPLKPKQQIASAGYAIRAESAQEVDSLPKGIILLWSGRISNIPAGWALCNGSNGTPDLRDKFIVGANQDSGGVAKTNVRGNLEQAGGEAKHILTVAEMPAHTHSESGHGNWGGRGGNDQAGGKVPEQTGSTGDGQAHENCPPFYALAYIMKL